MNHSLSLQAHLAAPCAFFLMSIAVADPSEMTDAAQPGDDLSEIVVVANRAPAPPLENRGNSRDGAHRRGDQREPGDDRLGSARTNTRGERCARRGSRSVDLRVHPRR